MNFEGRQIFEWSSYTSRIQIFETSMEHYTQLALFNPLLLKMFKVFKLVNLDFI